MTVIYNPILNKMLGEICSRHGDPQYGGLHHRTVWIRRQADAKRI